MTIKIQFRRDTAANWSSVNPILSSGEMGVETDTNKFKIGNGSDQWNTLGYGMGTQGPAGTITIGTVTSGVSAAVTNVGSPTNATLNFTLPQGPIGPEGPEGPEGPIGPASIIFNGSGAPSAGTGGDGDYYIDTSTGNMYVKATGSWGSPIASFMGPQGVGGDINLVTAHAIMLSL